MQWKLRSSSPSTIYSDSGFVLIKMHERKQVYFYLFLFFLYRALVLTARNKLPEEPQVFIFWKTVKTPEVQKAFAPYPILSELTSLHSPTWNLSPSYGLNITLLLLVFVYSSLSVLLLHCLQI